MKRARTFAADVEAGMQKRLEFLLAELTEKVGCRAFGRRGK